MAGRSSEEKAAWEAARTRVASYHEDQLSIVVAHVRSALGRLDAGDIDVFEFDDVVHQYKKAAQKLWSFCGGTSAISHSPRDSSMTNRLEDRHATDGSLLHAATAPAPDSVSSRTP